MKYVAYYRVSTKGQGRSGLGLDAQRRSVESYLKDKSLIQEFVEIESGKKNERVVLNEAITMCKSEEATLVIAKLDRLSRNASFTMSLVDSKVKFVAVDMPQATELTIGIMALLAQDEAKRISDRTKAALSSISERIDNDGFYRSRAGNKISSLGNPNNLTTESRARSAEIRKELSLSNENNKRAYAYANMLRHLSLLAIANALNSNNFKTRTGATFTAMSVSRLLKLYDENR